MKYKIILGLAFLIFLFGNVNAQQVVAPEYQLTQIGLDREDALNYNLQCQFVSSTPFFYNFKNKTYIAINITCLQIVQEGNMYSFYRRPILTRDGSLLIKYPFVEFRDCILIQDDDSVCSQKVIKLWTRNLAVWKKEERQKMFNFQSLTQDNNIRDLLINPNIGL